MNKKKKKDQRGIIMLISIGAMLIVYLVYGYFSAPPNLDDMLCPENTTDYLTGQIAIVLDSSDSLDYTQRTDARARVLRQLEAAPEYTEIQLYELSRDERQPARMEFRVCAPENPNKINWFDRLRKNRRIAKQQYEEEFIEPLESHLDELLAGPDALASPILKTIQDVAVDAFQPPDSRLPRQLILVSDMVQHSADMSFFEDPIDFRLLGQSPDYPTMQVDLEGVDITIFLLSRRGIAGQIQASRPIRKFWDEYFLDQGARQPQWKRVTG